MTGSVLHLDGGLFLPWWSKRGTGEVVTSGFSVSRKMPKALPWREVTGEESPRSAMMKEIAATR